MPEIYTRNRGSSVIAVTRLLAKEKNESGFLIPAVKLNIIYDYL
jgi:hypothetical protein